LDHGEVYFNLVQPTGMNRGVNLDRIRIPVGESFDRLLSSVGRPVIRHPKHAISRAIRLLLHHQINQSMKGFNPGLLFAQTENLCSMDIPGSHVGKSSTPFVFSLNPAGAMLLRWGAGANTFAGLNAGFFISTDHIVPWPQRFTLPNALVQVKDTTRFLGKVRVSRKYPTSVRPGLDRIIAEPAPNSGTADGGHDSASHRLPRYFIVAQSRKGKSSFSRHLASERFDLHNYLRGKNDLVFPVLADP